MALKHLKIKCCHAYIKMAYGDNSMKSHECRFLGYLKESIGCYFYHYDKQNVFIRNMLFSKNRISR